jgi:hypothetical protein
MEYDSTHQQVCLFSAFCQIRPHRDNLMCIKRPRRDELRHINHVRSTAIQGHTQARQMEYASTHNQVHGSWWTKLCNLMYGCLCSAFCQIYPPRCNPMGMMRPGRDGLRHITHAWSLTIQGNAQSWQMEHAIIYHQAHGHEMCVTWCTATFSVHFAKSGLLEAIQWTQWDLEEIDLCIWPMLEVWQSKAIHKQGKWIISAHIIRFMMGRWVHPDVLLPVQCFLLLAKSGFLA